MLSRNDLVLCAGSVMQAPFHQRVEIAAQAGFRGVSVWPTDYWAAREAGQSDHDLRSFLDDHDIEIGELDALLGWLPGGTEPDRPEFRAHFAEDKFFPVADALGARSMNIADLKGGDPPPLDAAAEAFAGVCDRAAEHGLLVHIEFIPWSRIPDIETAWDIARVADRPNGGVMLDNWHLLRSGGTLESVAKVPAERIQALQMSDAPAHGSGDLVEESIQRRLLPGEGDAHVAELIHFLDQHGCDAPIGVEVFSSELAAEPAPSVADRLGAAIRSVVGEARAA